MGPEINIESILALEKRIKEGTGDIIQLKRTRNSLLNISTRVPPEILGDIFHWNVIPEDDFDGLVKGSYNFILVCHHWFEVASNTPELWSFWGNSVKQWSRRYQHRGTAPIEVRLNGRVMSRMGNALFDGPLRDALRGHVERDSVRALHLSGGGNTDLLRSIFSVLIPGGQGIQRSSIESLSLKDPEMDVSDFFARRHFPKLRYLCLRATIGASTWVHLESHMTALTTLTLQVLDDPPTPTTSQLLSVLASNPGLQQLSITMPPFFKEHGDVSTPPIQLHHLKCLDCFGDFEPLLRLLHQIDRPEQMDEIGFIFAGCGVADVSEILGSYLRDCIQRDSRFRDGLDIRVTSASPAIFVQAAMASGVADPTLSPGYRPPFLTFGVSLAEDTSQNQFDKLCVDFVAHTPREHVVCLTVDLSPDPVKEIIPTMPNIQELTLRLQIPPEGFSQPAPDGPFASMKLLPSLRYLHLDNGVNDPDWSSLVSYLAYQTARGQVISLRITGLPRHICPYVVESIRSMVKELVLDLCLKEECPLGVCR